MKVTEDKEILLNLPRCLLAWYDGGRRVLPWREDPTPYHVWVSEIMLQQTRVEAVKPYYERFLAQFPDIAALAAASEEVLLKAWEGLGYYTRVRNLGKAANLIMTEYGGSMPGTYEEIIKLPLWAVAIIFIFAWHISIVLVVVSLFFDCRYTLEGKDDLSEANKVMGKASDAADYVKKEFDKL